MGMSSQIAPEYEAHLMNDSDWILRDDTVYLGTYEIAHYEDGKPNKWERYALYALPHANGLMPITHVSFGAHFGENLRDYLSWEICLTDNPMQQLGSSDAINVAVIRYLMLINKS